MSSERSSESNKWEKIEVDKGLVKKSLSLAGRDIKTAKNVFEDKDYDWCLAIAYNAMLQAGRALMFAEGYRPKGQYKHVAVIEFAQSRFSKDFAEKMLFVFNKTRKKRHLVVYEQVDVVSEEEARNVLTWAERFVNKTKEILKKSNIL